LGYNSSFFSLQALYSLKFLTGQSMHSLNGFFITVMLVYAFVTLGVWNKRKLATSDFVKAGFFLFFILGAIHHEAASPGTDTMTQFMLLYLAAKWSEYAEQEPEPSLTDYGWLGILAVWVVTIKLSGLVLMILSAYLAVVFIVGKEGKKLLVFLLGSVTVLIPFLIRNVIISGYLVYPLYWLDIFKVEWKMPLDVLIWDNNEIRAWGRGLTNPADYHAPLSVWFPLWFSGFTRYGRLLFFANIVCLVLAFALMLRSLIKRENGKMAVLLLLAVFGLLFWFMSAPLLRYGYVYMILLPAVVAGNGLLLARPKAEAIIARQLAAHRNWRRTLSVVAGAIGLLAVYKICLIGADAAPRYWPPPLVRQTDYEEAWNRAVEWQGLTIYVPDRGETVLGYNSFPGIMTERELETLRLRTGRLEGGFIYCQPD
jgi:hypothetical protein